MEKYITEQNSQFGFVKGTTESGLAWGWWKNDSRSLKSIRCGTLIVDGIKIFTKGTIQEALKYVSNH